MYSLDSSNARNSKLLIRLLVLILALLLTSLVQAQDAMDIAELPPCILSELQLRVQNGQPYIGGGSGGVGAAMTDPMPHGFLNNRLTQKGPGNKSPEDRMNDIGATPSNVLLLVIDDFTKPIWTSVTGQEITHGDYVMETITAAYHSFYDGYHVVVDSVDYASGGEITLAAASNAVQARLSQPDISRYDLIVFNMSWVILGCRVQIGEQEYSLEDFYRDRIPSQDGENGENLYDFIRYIEDNSGLERQQVTEELSTNIAAYSEAMASIIGDEKIVESDLAAILETLQTQAGSDATSQERIIAFWSLLAHQSILPVAAAGNFGRNDNIFAPAAWKAVVAVSGSVANSPGNLGQSDCARTPPQACLLWDSSNFGQVTAPAATHPTIRDEYISGTSFATPLTSVLVAIADSRGCEVFDLLNLPKEGNQYFVRSVFDVCRP